MWSGHPDRSDRPFSSASYFGAAGRVAEGSWQEVQPVGRTRNGSSSRQSINWHYATKKRTVPYGRASYTMLNGVSVALRKRLNPALDTTSRIRFSPDCAPRHSATSCEREHGVHSNVENE
jgi:hypothetical protein